MRGSSKQGRRRLGATVLAVVALGVGAVPATATAAPVEIKEFDLSPGCVPPGGTVHFRARVFNTRYWFTTVFGQVTAKVNGLIDYKDEVRGPYTLPPRYGYTIEDDVQLPLTVPPGEYVVTAGVGPSASNPQGWSRAVDSISVLPIC